MSAIEVASLIGVLGLETGGFTSGLEGARGQLDTFAGTMQRVGGGAQRLGTSLATIFGPAAAGVGLAVGAAIDFESAFAGVVKTVDATDEELGTLREGLRGMATDAASPVSALDNAAVTLSGIAEAAGQLGVETENILGFTETMGMLAMSTNLAAQDAATLSARFANITGMDLSKVDQFGAAIVDLGNNSATTEAEILDMALRLAAAGTMAGMEEHEILGIAAAMSSVGLQAEAGGTAMTRVLNEMVSAVNDVDQTRLRVWADTAGMTAAAFKDLADVDPAGAILEVTEGLEELDAGGKLTALEDLGLDDIRVGDTLRRLSGDSDLLMEALNTASEAWSVNTALVEEAGKRAETTESQLTQAGNTLKEMGVTIGETLLPSVLELTKQVTPLVTAFTDWAAENPELITQLSALAVGGALLGGALLLAGAMLSALGTVAGVAAGALGLLLSPVVLIAGGMALLLAAGGRLDEFLEDVGTFAGKAGEALGTIVGAVGRLVGGDTTALADLNAGLQGLGEAVAGIGISLIRNLADAVGELIGIDVEAGLAAWGPALEAAALAVSIIFDRIKRKIEEFVLNTQVEVLGFLQRFRQDIVEATGGRIDIAPGLNINVVEAQNKLNDMRMADTLEKALRDDLADAEINIWDTVMVGEMPTSVAGMFEFNAEAIAANMSVSGREAVRQAIDLVAQGGDEGQYNALVPLAAALDIPIPPLVADVDGAITDATLTPFDATARVDLRVEANRIDVGPMMLSLDNTLRQVEGRQIGGGGAPAHVAAFAEGGMVPYTGLIFAHAGERVLTPSQNRAWERGGGGGGVTNVYHVYSETPYELARMVDKANQRSGARYG